MPDQKPPEGDPQTQPPQVPAFETWLKAQPPEVTQILEGHAVNLKSALKSERETRQTLETQLRELSAKADQGSDTQKKIDALLTDLGTRDREISFFEAAHAVGVADLKLAYLAAEKDGLFDKKGNCNFDKLKELHPSLFGRVQSPPGGAGSGSDQLPAQRSMNDFIRAASGRRVG